MPDGAAGWIPPAIRAGRALLADWIPDVIIASGPPFSSFIIANSIASPHGIPWIADYRDLWTSSTYYPKAEWRRHVDGRLERRLLRTSRCAVSVSEPLCRDLEDEFGIKAVCIPNGYDPVELPLLENRQPLSSARLNVLYVGNSFYEGRRSPEWLLGAAVELGLRPSDFRLHFLGADPTNVAAVSPSLQKAADLVRFHPPVSRQDCMQWQARADALLLLMWNHPGEAGNVTGKLYEYVAARRPILVLGYGTSVAAELVRTRGLGIVASSEKEVRRVLEESLAEKPTSALKSDLPADCGQGLSRAERNQEWLDLLQSAT